MIHVAPEAEEEGCYYASGRGVPKGVGLMMLNHRLVRIDVYEPEVHIISGVGVGTSEAEPKHLYGGNLSQEPNAYTGPEGRCLTLRSVDGGYGVRFETDGQFFKGFYSGTAGPFNTWNVANEHPQFIQAEATSLVG